MNETLKRTLSGAVYIVVLVGSILYSEESFYLLFGFFLGMCVYEYCRMMKLPKDIAVILVSLAVYIVIYKAELNSIVGFCILAICIAISVKEVLFLFNMKATEIKESTKYMFLVGYILLPIIFITRIPTVEGKYNPKIIISIFILIWVNDTFAYLTGKKFGRRKLFEKVSPKKTVEGLVGGVIFAIFAGIIVAKFYLKGNEVSMAIWALIAVIVGVFGTIGDLVESKFKRIANVKDSGNIMPGHGGILDRLDSILFTAPIVFLFYQIIKYVS